MDVLDIGYGPIAHGRKNGRLGVKVRKTCLFQRSEIVCAISGLYRPTFVAGLLFRLILRHLPTEIRAHHASLLQ